LNLIKKEEGTGKILQAREQEAVGIYELRKKKEC
jgi:hypothetical protein